MRFFHFDKTLKNKGSLFLFKKLQREVFEPKPHLFISQKKNSYIQYISGVLNHFIPAFLLLKIYIKFFFIKKDNIKIFQMQGSLQ